jgi:DEAD/DEAH box helicase domain-containing protein
MLTRVLEELQRDPWFAPAIAAARRQESQPAARLDVPLRPDIAAALRHLGIEALYTHQAEALRLARRGDHVVVATPTASGKTLCFNLPVLETILQEAEHGRTAHALYLFPLKALEQDQLKSLLRLRDAIGLHESFRAAIFDGDTRPAERQRLRDDPPHILLTNPDMLHASLLPGHERWSHFFAGLRSIVLDELHTYRGVFGSHVLHILRRLRRIAALHGAAPQILAASATIQNPDDLASRLFGLPFTTVRDHGSPRGPRHVLLLDPPEGALGFATVLFSRLVRAGVKTIAFCKSRRATELLCSWAIERHPELKGRISAYRSGYLPEERREIESALFGGHLDGVVSTSALEMGIDVGGLDAAILVGYPGSIMSTWQRSGRAGRGDAPAALFLVAGQDALDQYWIASPDAFFRAEAEAAVVDPCNPGIHASHLLCAGAERALRADEPAWQDIDWKAARDDLHRRGLLLQSVDGDAWMPLMPRPHREVDIRQIGDTFTIHHRDQDRRVLGTIGGSRATAECHAGAVYLHRGQHLRVTSLDLERKRVEVETDDGRTYTMARSAKHTEILDTTDSRSLGRTTAHFGRLRITQRITGYEKRSSLDQKLLGTFELDLPPTIYETVGLWIEIDDGTVRGLEAAGVHRMGSLHAVEHAFIALSPLFTLCDAADIGGITFTAHPQVGRGAVFIYDSYPGGIGLAARTYEILPRVLDTVRRRIEDCGCDTGCPRCVHSPRCGSGNHPLDKAGAALALRLLLQIEAAPDATLPDPEPATPGRADDGASPAAARLTPHPTPALPAPATQPTASPPAAATGPPAVHSARSIVVSPHGLPRPQDGVAQLAQSQPLELVTPRILTFDVETRFAASQVGGWGRIEKMGLALAVTHDASTDTWTTYHERDVDALLEQLFRADLVVGYNVVRFDYRVLSAYTDRNLQRLPTFDMLLQLHACLGFRLSLGGLAQATLRAEKSADGLQSLAWVAAGRLDLVEPYCRRDVELTRDLFRYGLQHGYLIFDRKGMRFRTPPLDWDLDDILRQAARSRAALVRDRQALLVPPPDPRARW